MRLQILVLLICVVFICACVQAPTEQSNAGNAAPPGGKIKIGFAMDTVKEERWQRDRDAFDAHCKKMNVECVITVADNKADKQANDVDNLLTQGVNVLVI